MEYEMRREKYSPDLVALEENIKTFGGAPVSAFYLKCCHNWFTTLCTLCCSHSVKHEQENCVLLETE